MSNINHCSESWLVNMGNLIDKTWQDIFTRNTIKYDKFKGFNFDLDELEDFFVTNLQAFRGPHIQTMRKDTKWTVISITFLVQF